MRLDDLLGGAFVERCLHLGRDHRKRLVPAGFAKLALSFRAGPDERMKQTLGRAAPLAVIRDRTFAAQRAPADGVVWIADHAAYLAIALFHQNATGVVAVARTGRSHKIAAWLHPTFQNWVQVRDTKTTDPAKGPFASAFMEQVHPLCEFDPRRWTRCFASQRQCFFWPAKRSQSIVSGGPVSRFRIRRSRRTDGKRDHPERKLSGEAGIQGPTY